jgi:hypothetical protein
MFYKFLCIKAYMHRHQQNKYAGSYKIVVSLSFEDIQCIIDGLVYDDKLESVSSNMGRKDLADQSLIMAAKNHHMDTAYMGGLKHRSRQEQIFQSYIIDTMEYVPHVLTMQ